MKRLSFMLAFISFLTAQTATIQNSVIGYSSIGDTIRFEKPYLWTFIKDDNSKWMASIFTDAPWTNEVVYVEIVTTHSDKFTIGLGRHNSIWF